MPEPSGITAASPRQRAQARLPDGRILEAPLGTTLAKLLAAAAGDPCASQPPVAAIVNGRLRELTVPLTGDAWVTPIDAGHPDGVRIYRRSLVLLLVTAASELFPEAEVFIEHSATTAAGYYCSMRGRAPFSQAELDLIERRMREIAEEDAPFIRSSVPVSEAVELFRGRGEEDTARLLAHRQNAPVTLYHLRGHPDYCHGYLVASAGYLRHFALRAVGRGFVLAFPHQGQPDCLAPPVPYPKLFEVFEEAGGWLNRLGVRSAGSLNDAIGAGRLPEISLVAEALHEGRIAQIAGQIAKSRERVRVVLIAGPSSSGKTTFSKRLAVQLLAMGLRPFPIGLDDFFFDRDDTPLDHNGELDFERLEALDLARLEKDLLALLEGRTVELPHYDFKAGRRRRGATVSLEADNILILEGIHGLNPRLLPGLPAENLYRIYVSALTQLNLDRHNRVSTADCRLLRRLVRDAARRGYSAHQTIARWPSVTRGEKANIFPFQENADAIFNSSLVHELAVLRPLCEPLLQQIRPETPEFVEANRLLSFLQWFQAAAPDPVPDNSILREFIGGSILEAFQLWPEGSFTDQNGS